MMAGYLGFIWCSFHSRFQVIHKRNRFILLEDKARNYGCKIRLDWYHGEDCDYTKIQWCSIECLAADSPNTESLESIEEKVSLMSEFARIHSMAITCLRAMPGLMAYIFNWSWYSATICASATTAALLELSMCPSRNLMEKWQPRFSVPLPEGHCPSLWGTSILPEGH